MRRIAAVALAAGFVILAGDLIIGFIPIHGRGGQDCGSVFDQAEDLQDSPQLTCREDLDSRTGIVAGAAILGIVLMVAGGAVVGRQMTAPAEPATTL